MKKLFLTSYLLIFLSSFLQAQFFKSEIGSIVVGDSASDVIDLEDKKLISILPLVDTVEEDTLTFWTSDSSAGTFHKVYTDSVELVMRIAGRKLSVVQNPDKFYGLLRYIKIQYGAGAEDVDAADATDNFRIYYGYYR